jgi:hypothetical protein
MLQERTKGIHRFVDLLISHMLPDVLFWEHDRDVALRVGHNDRPIKELLHRAFLSHNELRK